MIREVRHSVLVPFLIDESIESIKVEKDAEGPGFSVLVIHKYCDFLGWLKTNATFADAELFDDLMESFAK
jgi:hypothetical protein